MIKVLFVCMGNICRSPAGESIFRHMVKEEGLEDKIYVDSAGTISNHVGECSDSRMIRHAEKRGYSMTHIARQFNPIKDFREFDYILVMDDANYRDIIRFDIERQYTKKLHRMAEYSTLGIKDVPDPYYGGPEAFEHVLDLLENACRVLLEEVKIKIEQSA
ncbi:MAG: low molecular weight protein-tyrosine-phosphatase [Methanococcaceae archaeon]